MTENTPENKGFFGEDAADLGNPADEKDVQRAAGSDAPPTPANIGTEFEPDTSEPQSGTVSTDGR